MCWKHDLKHMSTVKENIDIKQKNRDNNNNTAPKPLGSHGPSRPAGLVEIAKCGATLEQALMRSFKT